MSHAPFFAIDPAWKQLLGRLQINVDTVLTHAGLQQDLLGRATVGLSTAEMFALWEALEAIYRGDDLLLRIFENFQSDSFSPVCFAALCSPNMQVASERIARYKRLVAPMALTVKRDLSRLVIRLRWSDSIAPPPWGLAAIEAAFFVAMIRSGTEQMITPLRVRLPHLPEDPDVLKALFGVMPQLGRDVELSFSATDADRPFVTAREGLWSAFEPHLRSSLTFLERSESTRLRVRSALLSLLPSGRASMEAVADRLALSRRTLQRRLHQSGTSYMRVLAETRHELALHYLRRTALPHREIAFLLGFEDPNSFFRAFQQWTHRTPEWVRREAPEQI